MRQLNAIGNLTNTKYGINDMSDWTIDEFKSVNYIFYINFLVTITKRIL